MWSFRAHAWGQLISRRPASSRCGPDTDRGRAAALGDLGAGRGVEPACASPAPRRRGRFICAPTSPPALLPAALGSLRHHAGSSAIASIASRSTVVTVSPLLRELMLRAVDERMLDERDQTHRALVHLIVRRARWRRHRRSICRCRPAPACAGSPNISHAAPSGSSQPAAVAPTLRHRRPHARTGLRERKPVCRWDSGAGTRASWMRCAARSRRVGQARGDRGRLPHAGAFVAAFGRQGSERGEGSLMGARPGGGEGGTKGATIDGDKATTAGPHDRRRRRSASRRRRGSRLFTSVSCVMATNGDR